MSIANINNGETGLSARGKINQSIDIVNLGVVTGATLNVSTLEFNTNNTADAFNVDLSTLSTVDNFTTGATLSNGVISFDRNDTLNAYSVDINPALNNFLPITGGTLTGSLSATTYFGDGSNLTGISTVDNFTTGATLNGTVLEFDRNDTLNAYSVDISSVNTNTFTTGGTYNSVTEEIDFVGTNTATTFSVDISSVNTNTFTTGGTYNSVTEEIDFFGNSAETTFSVDVSGLTPFNIGCFGVTIDGAGSVITTGLKGSLLVPYDCTIDCWAVIADQSGSIVVDVWKGSSPLTIPTSASDSIAGTEKPTLSSQQINTDLTLTTWTTSLVFGDVLVFNVDSVSTVTRVTLQIKVIKV